MAIISHSERYNDVDSLVRHVPLRLVRSRSIPLSRFGEYLTELCERSGITLFEAGLRIGIRSRSRMGYVTRQIGQPRAAALPVSDVRRLARVLGCDPREEERLVLLGALEQAPPELRNYLAQVERELARAWREKGHPPPHPLLLEGP